MEFFETIIFYALAIFISVFSVMTVSTRTYPFGYPLAIRAIRNGRYLLLLGYTFSGFRSNHGIRRWYRGVVRVLHPAHQWRR